MGAVERVGMGREGVDGVRRWGWGERVAQGNSSVIPEQPLVQIQFVFIIFNLPVLLVNGSKPSG